jgi:hypothetical protein
MVISKSGGSVSYKAMNTISDASRQLHQGYWQMARLLQQAGWPVPTLHLSSEVNCCNRWECPNSRYLVAISA